MSPRLSITIFTIALAAGLIAQPHPAVASENPLVYIELDKPDESKGVLKLARHRATKMEAVAPNATLVTTLYEELCTEPCGVSVDVSERPIFFFLRDGAPASYGFRLSGETGVVTLRVRPRRDGFAFAAIITSFTVIGNLFWIPARPIVWLGVGRPNRATDFTKLRRAR